VYSEAAITHSEAAMAHAEACIAHSEAAVAHSEAVIVHSQAGRRRSPASDTGETPVPHWHSPDAHSDGCPVGAARVSSAGRSPWEPE
jgi:hypothetical protein